MDQEKQLAEIVKAHILDSKTRHLCNTSWCGLKDGYCPKFDCCLVDKLKAFSNRQWQNAVKKVLNVYTNLTIEDLADEVLEEMASKRTPR